MKPHLKNPDMKIYLFIATLLLCLPGCMSKNTGQLTEQQKDQIKKEIIAVGDSIIAKAERLDPGWLDYYADSPDWGMVNADGTRWDYQYNRKVQSDLIKAFSSYKWIPKTRDIKILAGDIAILAWDGKDVTVMKSGERLTLDPHAYTLIFRKIVGQWKIIYSHDSGVPVTEKTAVEAK